MPRLTPAADHPAQRVMRATTLRRSLPKKLRCVGRDDAGRVGGMTQYPPARRAPAFSIPSILALICAVGSFLVGPGLGMLLAILAIILGGIGVVLALAPQTRGGIASMMAILAGAIGIIGAVLRLVFRAV